MIFLHCWGRNGGTESIFSLLDRQNHPFSLAASNFVQFMILLGLNSYPNNIFDYNTHAREKSKTLNNFSLVPLTESFFSFKCTESGECITMQHLRHQFCRYSYTGVGEVENTKHRKSYRKGSVMKFNLIQHS